MIIGAALKDARLTNNDIYLTYIDFRNAFGFIDHAKLLALMKDLGYPQDAVELIGNIYTNSTTSFHGNNFGTTLLLQINKDTIQGDTFSPYLFTQGGHSLFNWCIHMLMTYLSRALQIITWNII